MKIWTKQVYLTLKEDQERIWVKNACKQFFIFFCLFNDFFLRIIIIPMLEFDSKHFLFVIFVYPEKVEIITSWTKASLNVSQNKIFQKLIFFFIFLWTLSPPPSLSLFPLGPLIYLLHSLMFQKQLLLSAWMHTCTHALIRPSYMWSPLLWTFTYTVVKAVTV